VANRKEEMMTMRDLSLIPTSTKKTMKTVGVN
jgi:hypothetical protein